MLIKFNLSGRSIRVQSIFENRWRPEWVACRPKRPYNHAMKFGVLTSVGHNIADSLASGIGLMIGYDVTDIFKEASSNPEGFITVDFLTGTATGGVPSPDLAWTIREYAKALPGLCERHGVEISEFAKLTARYGVDRIYGGHFTVTVEDRIGRASVDRFVGVPGRKVPRAHKH